MSRNSIIKSSQHTNWSEQNESVSQPDGINYDQLLHSLKKQDKVQEKTQVANRKDLRKTSYNNKVEQEDGTLKEIDKGSIIPVPGLVIEHENSESDMKPPESNWVAPHGQQWNPMTI